VTDLTVRPAVAAFGSEIDDPIGDFGNSEILFAIDSRVQRIQTVFVRIIKTAFLAQAERAHPRAASYLETWRKVVGSARWQSLAAVRRTYPSADAVRVKSGRQVIVFNVCGKDFRLVVAMHFNRQRVYTLRFMTHAEYSKDKWKDTL
jgi:mRNA interferase HigB